MTDKRIYTIWPSNKNGEPGGHWHQYTRWLVLDVTEGLQNYEVIAGPIPRLDAIKHEMVLRAEQEPKPHKPPAKELRP